MNPANFIQIPSQGRMTGIFPFFELPALSKIFLAHSPSERAKSGNSLYGSPHCQPMTYLP